MLSKEFVDEVHRRKFVAAAAVLADERGTHKIAVPLLATRAKSSKATFYGVFANSEECFQRAWDEGARLLFERLPVPDDEEIDWPQIVSTSLRSIAEAAASDPALARFYLRNPYLPGRDDEARRAGGGIKALAERLASRRGAGAAPTTQEELVACAYLAALRDRLEKEELADAVALPDELAPWVLRHLEGRPGRLG